MASKTWKPWTDEDVRTLRALAKTKTGPEIAAVLGRSRYAIGQYAHLHGISLHKRGDTHARTLVPDADVALMRALKADGMKPREIAEKFELTVTAVYNLLRFDGRSLA